MQKSTHKMVIRNRLRVETGEGDVNMAPEYHGSEGRHARSAHPGKIITTVVVLSFFFAGCMGTIRRRPSLPPASPMQEARTANISPPPKKDWSHCSIEPRPPKSRTNPIDKVEPLWLPAYPTALPAVPYADLVTALTGVSNGAKNYYRGSKNLKRCHNVKSENNVQAVTCEIVHPIVPCLQPHPSAQAANFGNAVLMALRNPLTAFPAYHQSKAELYHGQKGQVEKGEWIEFRDQYVEDKLFAEWKDFIMEWRDMRPYTVGGYMLYENWADETKGPSLVISLSQLLKNEGFPVMYDFLSDDGRRELECLWRKHIYEAIAEEEKERVDWYVPKYTTGQLEFMATGLDAFAREIEEKQDDGKRPGDEHLMTILRDYRNAIRDEL